MKGMQVRSLGSVPMKSITLHATPSCSALMKKIRGNIMRQMPYISRQRFPRDRHDGFIHKISRIQDVQTNAVLCQPSASVEDTTPNAEAQDRWIKTVIFFAGAMALASAHRVTFSVLAVPLQQELGLSLPQMGILQSAVLAGYVLGQIPLGYVADKIGGTPVMHVSLVLWSCVTGLTSFVRGAPQSMQFPALLLSRVTLGISQSCIMPATSAMAAKCLPQQYRARALSFVYAAFSLGMVAGLVCFPAFAAPFGWPTALIAFAAGGIGWGVFGALTLPPEQMSSSAPVNVKWKGSDQNAPRNALSGSNLFQVLVLCWTHCVIGWGFFIFQFWMPTYLHSLGAANLSSMGLLSALPWSASAVGGLAAGWLADHLQETHLWKLARVRSFIQTVATIGPAVSLVPLILAKNSCGLGMAVACLTAFMGLQAFAYSGFHAYVQEVAPRDAGKLLGLSNSASTLVGMAGNVVTGGMAASTWGYSGLFAVTAVLYTGSCLTWNACMKGQPLTLG